MKKGKFKQRLLAVLLTAVMLLTGLPSTVLAAGDGGTSTLSSDVYVQDLVSQGSSGMAVGEQTWYSNDEGIIEIPALDRELVMSRYYGIKIMGLSGIASIDFTGVSGGSKIMVSSSTGTLGITQTFYNAFNTAIQEEGYVDAPITDYFSGAEIVTLRFVNKHDNETSGPDTQELKVYYTPVNGEPQPVENSGTLTVPVPADQKGGTLSYEGIVLEEGYWAKWETANEDGENMDLPIYCEWDRASQKYNLIITGPGTVTVSLNQYQGNSFNDYTTLFSFELTAESDEEVTQSVQYTDTKGNTQDITENFDLYLQKGKTGSLQVNGTEESSFVWKTDSEDSIEITEDGQITAKEAGTTNVSVKTAEGTPVLTFQVQVLDVSVSFAGSSGTVEIEEDGVLAIGTAETGNFKASGAESLPEGKDLRWKVDGDYPRPISIATGTGELYIEREGSVNAYLVIEDYDTMATSAPLCSFTITASSKELEDIQVKVNKKEITEGKTVKAEGSAYQTIEVLGKYTGEENYVPISNQGYTLSSDSEILTLDVSGSGTGYLFSEPGEAEITVNYGTGTFTFTAESTFVPVDEIKLSFPDEIELHTLIYGMRDGDNYTAFPEVEGGEASLLNSYEVTPKNASFARSISWSSDNPEVAEYMDTHSNGFIGHSEGEATLIAEIDQGTYGEKVRASQKVAFVYKYPVEELKTDTPELTVETGKKVNLDIQFTPAQPSQGLIKWTQSGSGEVEVQRGKNDIYADLYSNLNYSIKGVKAGEVTLTGTPVSIAEGKNPSITFKITVTGESGGTQDTSDTAEIVKELKESAQKYYETNSVAWTYGEEWNVISFNRAGLTMEEADKEAYLESVKAQLSDEEGQLTEDGKPTDFARVIMALYSLGENPRDFADTDLLQTMMKSERLDQGSNEVMWALLTLDAVGENIPEGSSWTREKLVADILEYQCEDGSFALSKGSKNGSVDITAMALQSLAAYQEKEEVKAATEKALDYLKDKIYEGDYGSVESDAQAAVALLMLGIDPCDKENGFAEDDITIYQAMEQYEAAEGGFKHNQADDNPDKMATQQVLLAIAAWERYSAGENSVYDMTDVASPVDPVKPENPENPEKPVGYVTLAVEKFTIGQGYLVEPELVPIYKDMTEANLLERLFRIGENSTVAEALTQYLEDHNLEYKHSGTVEEAFYLAAIIDTEGSKTANFPEETIKYAEEHNITLKTERKKDSLGEFDYSNGSGWKYTINDDMTDKGMSQTQLKDGDVVRVSFTAIDYGADLGNKEGSFMPVTNRDGLTRMLAEINSANNKEELLASPNVKAAYRSALQTVSNLAADQESLDEAAEALEEAQKNPDNPEDISEAVKNVMDLIDAIGDNITLDSKEAINQARAAYDALSEEEKQQVGDYYNILKAAEDAYQKLEEAAEADQKAAQAVMDKINAIGEVSLNSGKSIQEARKAYEALTQAQKALVTNLNVLEEAENAYAALNQAYLQEQKDKAKAELDAYKDLTQYAEAQQEELKAIIAEGKKAIEEAQDVTGITAAKEAAMLKMDEVKTKAELEDEEEGKDPVTLTNDQYKISVTGENLTEDMVLQVVPLTAEDEAVAAMRKEIPSSKALIKPYEISILKNGEKVDVEGPFTVTYQMDSKYNDKELEVFLINSQGKLTAVKGTVKDGSLSVTVDTLGSMAVVVDASTVSTDKTDSDNTQSGGSGSSGTTTTSGNAKTGDETETLPLVCLMLVSAAVIGGLAARKKYFKGQR